MFRADEVKSSVSVAERPLVILIVSNSFNVIVPAAGRITPSPLAVAIVTFAVSSDVFSARVPTTPSVP